MTARANLGCAAAAQRSSSALMRMLRSSGRVALPPDRATWACAQTFPRRLDGLRCGGLSPLPGIADAASCQAACCAQPPVMHKVRPNASSGCDVWQYCASPEQCGTDAAPTFSRCWVGSTCVVANGRRDKLQPGWVGAARAHVFGFNRRGPVSTASSIVCRACASASSLIALTCAVAASLLLVCSCPARSSGASPPSFTVTA